MNDRELTRRRLLELGLALPARRRSVRRRRRARPRRRSRSAPHGDADDRRRGRADARAHRRPLLHGQLAAPPFDRARRRRGNAVRPLRTSLTTAAKPVARALIDFWQCDARGAYDNSGYRFRGHQFTDAKGRYSLATVVPGVYPGRTKHIHVKVQAPRRSVLTTQLFFPGVSGNRADGIYTPECLVTGWRVVDGRRVARFDFVLDL